MNMQTIPKLASRGGHDDKLSTVHIPDPRNRAEEALSPADRLRRARDAAKAAIAAAGQAEAEGVSNRDKARKAEDEARHAERDLERQEKAWAEQSAREVQRLEDALRRLTSGKVGPPQVAPITRAHARLYLHGGGGGEDGALVALQQLQRADTHFAQLHAINRAAGHGLGIAQEHAGDEILAKLDAVEVASWRLIVARCQAIAGEVEDPS